MLDFAMVVLMIFESWIFTIVLAFVDGSAPSTGACSGFPIQPTIDTKQFVEKCMHWFIFSPFEHVMQVGIFGFDTDKLGWLDGEAHGGL